MSYADIANASYLSALEEFRDLVESKIDGRIEGHPWIPGANFADGKILDALKETHRFDD